MVTITKYEYNHPYSGATFFSFKATILNEHGSLVGTTFTCWMVYDKDTGELLETAAISDDCYDDEPIHCSPVVHLPKPCDYTLEPYESEIHDAFTDALAEHLGIEYQFPQFCNGGEFDKVVDLKMKLGYKFCDGGFYPV